MRILAVDDDEVFLDILKMVLVEEGYEDITLATNGAHALQLISDAVEPFQCFLIDMVMPKMDGVELCKQIRAKSIYKQTPILMVTALVDELSVDRAFIAGANDFVTKPLNMHEVIGRVQSAAILVAKANKEIALKRPPLQREAAEVSLSKPRLAQATFVETGPNCLSVEQLEGMLLALPRGAYAMSCFAVQISETENLFVGYSDDDFCAVLTRVATHIAEELGVLNHRFAYYGNGTFGCVAFGRKARLNTERGLNCFGIKETIIGFRRIGRVDELRLSFREPRTIPLLTGEQAVKCIRDSIFALSEAKVVVTPDESLPSLRSSQTRTKIDHLDVERISNNLFLEIWHHD
jgi:DNA-binding response OmpR family regulator